MGELKLPDDYYEDDETPYSPKKLTAKERAQAMGWPVDVEDPETEEPTNDLEQAEQNSGQEEPETPFTFKGETPVKGSVILGDKKKKKGKKRLIVSGIVGGGLVAVIFVMMMFFGLQKIIQLSEHIAVYNLAQSSRTLRLAEANILEENIASETIDGSLYQNLKARFGESKLGAAIDRFNLLRPEKIFKNLNSKFEPTYTTTGTTVFGTPKKTLAGWAYTDANGVETFVQKNDTKLFRPLKNSAERVRVASEFEAMMEKDLQGVKTYVRGRVIKKLLADKDIRLRWWDKLGKKYQGLTEDAAGRLAQQDAMRIIDNPDEGSCVVSTVCESAKKTEAAAKKAVNESTEGGAASSEYKADQATKNTLKSSLEESGIQKALGYASVINAVAVPLCLIYDGSIENAKGSIDANSTALEKKFFSVVSAADQQKKGDTTSEAVGGFSDTLGDTTNSVPEARASGATIDTAQYVNPLELPQSSASGSYSLLNVTLGDSVVVDVMNKLASHGCGFVTDLRTQLVIAAAEFTAMLFTDGASKGGEEAATAGVKTAVENLGKRLLFTNTREKGVARTTFKFLGKIGFQVGATLGLTDLAKLSVVKHMGAANTGVSTNQDAATEADMGGVIYGQQDLGRNLLYGRPMTTPEVVQAKVDDMAYLNGLNSRKSVTERYFAISNPSSLISKLGFSGYSFLSKPGSISGKVFVALGNMFSGSLKTVSSLMIGSNSVVHAAATTSGAGDYNIVRWGWTDEELRLVDANPDQYAPMINDLILDASGKKSEIENKYGKCYANTVGTLLSSGAIKREIDGAVIEDTGESGDCSPKNLGIHNADYLDSMVFRWRLSKKNENVKNHLLDIQNPTTGSDAPAADLPTPTPGVDVPVVDDTSAMTCPVSTTITDAGVVDDAYKGGRGPLKERLCWVQIGTRRIRFNVLAAANFDNLFKGFVAAGYTLNSVDADGYRTYEQQAVNYARNPSNFAPPGKSNHEYGTAVDIQCSGGGGPDYKYGGKGSSSDKGLSYFLNTALVSPCLNWIHQNSSSFGLLLQCDGRNSKGEVITGGEGGACEPWHLSPTGG